MKKKIFGESGNKSGPTIIRQTTWEYEQKMVEANVESFETVIATFFPELYGVWQTTRLYKVNPEVLPVIIKAIGDIAYSSKLGEVIIEIRPDPVTGEAVIRRVRSVDTRHLDVSAIKK